MGRVRGFPYDAVIGVGGIGSEAKSHGIDGKINWIGIGPTLAFEKEGYRSGVFQFEHFVIFDHLGPRLESKAKNLADKMYHGRRYILDKYSAIEKAEALAIIEWARSSDAYDLSKRYLQTKGPVLLNASSHLGCTKCFAIPVNPKVERACTQSSFAV